ncbi:hypothetical protein KY290_027193 [Solanum tuberosum]|uniref:Chorismate-utilising enzyme C-terminal domain-containing protein n=1 Tax=Solanum tuberosum TaxID=4113 RepID=A0ABQ7UE98_SOLTU|nr:hypothetical protein KY290_027193 [Solanum tuberosum]
MTREEYKNAILQAKEYISSEDIHQIVLSQRQRLYFSCIKSRNFDACEETGTSRRGRTLDEDVMLEMQMLKDEKQCAENIMLVDLGRNDVRKVSGELLDHLTCWDALRAALSVGTIYGAPKDN